VTTITNRGRPALRMTHRRQQVLAVYADRAVQGERISLAEVARRCGLYDYRDVRRIVGDLREMKKIS